MMQAVQSSELKLTAGAVLGVCLGPGAFQTGGSGGGGGSQLTSHCEAEVTIVWKDSGHYILQETCPQSHPAVS